MKTHRAIIELVMELDICDMCKVKNGAAIQKLKGLLEMEEDMLQDSQRLKKDSS